MIKAYLSGQQENWELNLGCHAERMYGGQYNNSDQEIKSCGDYVEYLKEIIRHAHEVARKHPTLCVRRQSEVYDAKLAFHKYKLGDVFWAEKTSVRTGLSQKLQPFYHGYTRACIIII